MAIQTIMLDPDAQAYSDNDIVDKINAASNQITRTGSVSAAARPIEVGEIIHTMLAATAAKLNLDALADVDRGYVKTNPSTGQFKVISMQRHSDGKIAIDYDDVAA